MRILSLELIRPRLIRLGITFFMDLIFDIPCLHNFIDRTEGLKPFKQADIWLSGWTIKIFLGSPAQLELKIRCERPDWQLSSMTQIFSQPLPLLSLMERLEICDYPSSWGEVEWIDDKHGFPAMARTVSPAFRCAEAACIREAGAPCCKGSTRSHGSNDHESFTCVAVHLWTVF